MKPPLVTGSSSGIGLATGRALAEEEVRVCATLRDGGKNGRLMNPARLFGVGIASRPRPLTSRRRPQRAKRPYGRSWNGTARCVWRLKAKTPLSAQGERDRR